MKRYIYYIAALLATMVTTSCAEMMNDARKAEKVELIEVAYKIDIEDLTTTEGDKVAAPADWYSKLEVKFVNFAEQLEIPATLSSDGLAQAELIPGIYNIVVRSSQEYNGANYILNGLAQNIAFTKSTTEAEINEQKPISITPLMGSPLCFRELFYSGALGWYLNDQFYEVYNNSDKVMYLDHLCLALLEPEFPTTILPEWPAEDGDGYVYSSVLWQIQGDGDDYPLQPGESVVFVQEAADHIKVSEGGSVINSLASADFECWSGNPQRINPNVPDIPYVFWVSVNSFMWMTSVDGSAFALYQPGKNLEFGSDYWKEGVTTSAKVGGNGQQYARLPIKDILDAVECIPTPNDLDMKRVPGILDSGAASANGYFEGKSVARKIDSYREDGSPIFQDTNNSTADFEVCDAAVIRRHNVKQPSWSIRQTE